MIYAHSSVQEILKLMKVGMEGKHNEEQGK